MTQKTKKAIVNVTCNIVDFTLYSLCFTMLFIIPYFILIVCE
jgi:hypothetical protein